MTLEDMKRIKQEKGYSLARLSQERGVPLGTVQKIFSGETAHPRFATRQALEKVLKKDPEYVDADRLNNQSGMMKEEETAYHVSKSKQQGEYTLEDYYALPDDRRVELIDGVIYDMAVPTFVHQCLIGVIFNELMNGISGKKGGCIPMLSPVDVRLDCDDRTMVQPDVLILCDQDKIRRWGIDGAPDFVLETLSDSTKRKDCILKLHKYADAGVKEYWIIDPFGKKLITYDFREEIVPHIYPLEGEAGLAICDRKLKVDLERLAEVIRDWPDTNNPYRESKA